LYPTQPYDRAKFGKAMDNLPKKATEPTMLTKGLKKLDPLLAAYLNENKNAYVSLLHPHWEPFQNGLTGQTFFHRHIRKFLVTKKKIADKILEILAKDRKLNSTKWIEGSSTSGYAETKKRQSSSREKSRGS
jgi:hypothetical protein